MSTYTGNNQQLQYNAETGTWSLTNIAQNFVDTSTFSTLDPKFEYVNTDDSDDDTTVDPCPIGYILKDGTCVVDPDYVPPTQASGDGGGGQPTPTPKQQSEYDLNREALESFSALVDKDKIDFDSYDPKTKTVKLKDPENKNMVESLVTLFSPGTVIADAVFDAKDKADLGAVEYGGVKAYSENEKGEGSINLEVLYNNLQTKVLNPGVPEGNLLVGTPSYNGTDDTNGFYKTFFTSFEIPKEQRKFFGATNINDIFEASLKARKASDDLLTKPTADIKDSSSSSDSGDGGNVTPPPTEDSSGGNNDEDPPRPEGTTEPGSGYQAGSSAPTRPEGTTQPGSGYQAGSSRPSRPTQPGSGYTPGSSRPSRPTQPGSGYTPGSNTPTGINRPGRD